MAYKRHSRYRGAEEAQGTNRRNNYMCEKGKNSRLDYPTGGGEVLSDGGGTRWSAGEKVGSVGGLR